MIVEQQLGTVVGGVDTHANFHVAAAIDAVTGRVLGDKQFGADPTGYRQLREWLTGFGDLSVVGVEGTGSYGAGLSRDLVASGIEVVEVDRPNRQARYRDGKDDNLDAIEAAKAVLSGRATGRPKSGDGTAEAIRVIEVVCHSATKDRTRAINQFKAILVSSPASLRTSMARIGFGEQLSRARRFRTLDTNIVTASTRTALRHLARRIEFLDTQIGELETQMSALAAQVAPALLGLVGVGPHVAARLIATAGDNVDRNKSESAFAKICGVSPIPASSGNTRRHRLNRGGDRRANNALYTIVLVRMRYDERTKTYVQRRTAEGKTKKEIIRCLKRYVAREVYNTLTNPPTDIPTGAQLRTLRNEAGQTLAHLAFQAGVEPMRISRLERGLDHNNQLARKLSKLLTQTS